jgi:hypothetical protein
VIALILLLALQDSAKLDQEIEYANLKDKPQFHVQAVRKLKDRGGPAVAEAITAYVAKRGHGALSIAFTEGLGDLQDPRITALLRELVRDKDFLWRPTAMRALAARPEAGSRDDFRAALELVQKLAESIGQLPGYRCEVVESPLDVRTSIAIQGRHSGSDPATMEARFVLRVMRERGTT